jgi:hypothetical protein
MANIDRAGEAICNAISRTAMLRTDPRSLNPFVQPLKTGFRLIGMSNADHSSKGDDISSSTLDTGQSNQDISTKL